MKNDLNHILKGAIEDVRELHSVLDRLVILRKSLNLTQKQVGERMGVKQSAISAFESEESNPQIETVQRYSRALGAKLKIDVDFFPDWDSETASFRGSYEGSLESPANATTELVWND